MAQVPRTSAASPTNPVAMANRAANMARGVASADSGPVESMSAQVGVANRETQFDFGEFQEQNGDRREWRRRAAPPTRNTNIVFPTDGFRTEGMFDEQKARAGLRGFSSLLHEAISSYETTARVISGGAKFRGISMNFVL